MRFSLLQTYKCLSCKKKFKIVKDGDGYRYHSLLKKDNMFEFHPGMSPLCPHCKGSNVDMIE